MKISAKKGGSMMPSGSEDSEFDDYIYTDPDNYSGSYLDDCPTSGVVSYPEADVSDYIQLVGFPLLLLQGVVGNALAIPVLYSISCRAWSTVIYLALLGGTDLCILLVQCGDIWYKQVMMISLNEIIMSSSDSACKTYHFLFTCIKHLNPWLIVASSVEMMVATRWPKRTYTMCTLERARYVLMLMLIIIVCLDMNYFWTIGVPKPTIGCRYTEDFSVIFRDWIWPAMDNMVELILPMGVVTICFFMTATTMIRRPASQERDTEARMKNYFMAPTTLRDFQIVCLVISLVFMCLITFKITNQMTSFLLTRGYIVIECQSQDKFAEAMRLFDILIKTFFYAFYGVKIYLYMALSSHFRRTLMKGFLCIGRKIKQLFQSTKTFAVSRRDDKGSNGAGQNQNRPLIHGDSSIGQSNNDGEPTHEGVTGAATNSADVIDLTNKNAVPSRSEDKVQKGASRHPHGVPVRNCLAGGHQDSNSHPALKQLGAGTKV